MAVILKSRRLQLGRESTAGTEVAATGIFPGLTDLRIGPQDEWGDKQFLDGNIAVSRGIELLGKGAHIPFESYLCFENFPAILEMGYKAITPAADGGSPIAYTYAVEPTLTSLDAPKTRTAEYHDDAQDWTCVYCMAQNFEIAIQRRGYTMLNGELVARDMDPKAGTGSLTPSTVETCLGQNWSAYLDTAWAGLGGTEVTPCLVGVTFRSGGLYERQTCIDGTQVFSTHLQQAQQPEAVLTFKVDAATYALFSTYRAATRQFLRLENIGAIIHDAVTKRVRIDLSAQVVDWPDIGAAEDEGAMTVDVTLRGALDPTSAKLVAYAVVNRLATLPM